MGGEVTTTDYHVSSHEPGAREPAIPEGLPRVFKSVGMAEEDLVVAAAAYEML